MGELNGVSPRNRTGAEKLSLLLASQPERPAAAPPSVEDLQAAIEARRARTGIIGLGYVGLPLLASFAEAGFEAVGIDTDRDQVERIGRGESHLADLPDARLRTQVANGRLRATADFGALADLDTVSICVPTPLNKTRSPDLSHVAAAVEEVARCLRPGQLVVLESTTWPGTVEEFVRPRLEAGGLRAGRDFFLAFSPERLDPGNREWATGSIPRIVGGVDPGSTRLATTLYEQIVETVVPVSSTRAAETVKLLENTFRSVNIGLANEFALMCRSLGVDVWEVVEAAATKPFGFMSFQPGPGVGGHCIPVDPHYLLWGARQSGFESRFIELAAEINANMPEHVARRVAEVLEGRSTVVEGARIHLAGVAYKPGVSDIRESPALDVARLLADRGAVVSYSDPFVPEVETDGVELPHVPLDEALDGGVDCVVVTTHHRNVDYAGIVERAPLVLDTRNALAGVKAGNVFSI